MLNLKLFIYLLMTLTDQEDDLFAEVAPKKTPSGGGGGLFDDVDDLFAAAAPPKAQPDKSQPAQSMLF